MNLEREAFSIDEFCARQGISRSTFYNLEATSKAPVFFMVGCRRFISRSAEQKWQREREAEAQAEHAVRCERLRAKRAQAASDKQAARSRAAAAVKGEARGRKLSCN